MITNLLPQLLQLIFKYWKELILIGISIVLAVTTLFYKGEYEGVLNEHSSLIQQVELNNAKVLAENERVAKEHQLLLANLESKYRESLESKQHEITQLENNVADSNSRIDSLLNTLRETNSTATTSTTSTKETAVRQVDVLSRLYEESLRNGREASEAIERTKIAYTQCRNDVNSIYEAVNQYNLRVTKQNTNFENKE